MTSRSAFGAESGKHLLILSFSHFLEPRNAPNVQVVVRWVMSNRAIQFLNDWMNEHVKAIPQDFAASTSSWANAIERFASQKLQEGSEDAA